MLVSRSKRRSSSTVSREGCDRRWVLSDGVAQAARALLLSLAESMGKRPFTHLDTTFDVCVRFYDVLYILGKYERIPVSSSLHSKWIPLKFEKQISIHTIVQTEKPVTPINANIQTE